jgi:hypothetical protein
MIALGGMDHVRDGFTAGVMVRKWVRVEPRPPGGK